MEFSLLPRGFIEFFLKQQSSCFVKNSTKLRGRSLNSMN